MERMIIAQFELVSHGPIIINYVAYNVLVLLLQRCSGDAATFASICKHCGSEGMLSSSLGCVDGQC